MTKNLETYTRNEALFLVAHELMHRLLQIEPNSVTLRPDGQGSMLATTEEGRFLVETISMVDAMRGAPK